MSDTDPAIDLRGTRAVLPQMIAQQAGRIMIVSSQGGITAPQAVVAPGR